MYKKITIGAFLVSLLAFFTLVFIFPSDERASLKENRPLAEMPEFSLESLFEGQFTSQYETFLSDNVGLRSYFTALGSGIENTFGFTIEAQGQIVNLPSGSTLALHGGKIMEVFRQNDTVRNMYISTLNEYAKIKPENTNMYVMLVPTQIEFDQSKYAELSDSQQYTITEIYNSLSGITPVNVYDSLKEHRDEYVYFRTDHHWTQRGAYLGYEAIAKAVGFEAVPLSDMGYNKRSNFLGYLYNQANVPGYSQYADDIEYFLPGENYDVAASLIENGEFVEYTAKIISPPAEGAPVTYGIFMGGDHAFAKINTNIKNGRTALVIKDSYANALVPFLTNHYENLIVIDPRNYYGTVTQLFSEYQIDDVFVINYAFSSTLEGYTSMLDGIR